MGSLAFYVSALLLVSPILGLKYDDCGSGATVSDVEIAGCENQDECELKRGSSVHLSIKFKSNSDSKSLTIVIHGVIAGVPMPFPFPRPNACEGTGIACPLKSGQDYSHDIDFEVKSSYPPLAVVVKYELRDENGNDVVCVKIPTKLT